MKNIVITFLNLALLLRSSISFPSQAGGCDGGKAAVGESHLSNANGFQELSLSDAGIKVFIGTNEIQEGSRFGVLAGTPYPISVEGQFKGVLIRLEAELSQLNMTADLTPGTNAQVASVCEAPVVGITHVDNSIKSEFSGTLLVEEPVAAVVDITVVLQNNETGSIFAYGGFNLLFVDSAPTTPTLAPTIAPSGINATSSPTASPTAGQVCFVCGANTLDVSPNLTTVFDGVEISCGELSQNGRDGLIAPIDCNNATFAAQQDCECAPIEVSQPPAVTTPSPTSAPVTETPTRTPIQTPVPAPVQTPAPVPVATPAPTKSPEAESGDNGSTDPNPPSGDSGDECPSSKKSKSGKSGKSSKCRKVKKKKSESKRSSEKIKKSKSKSSRRRLRASV
jgi:hypothetical protein